MPVPRGRAWPVMFLLLLSPLVAEVLWGTTTVTNPAVYLIQIGMYGGGAVLIREVVRRWGGGWPSILLLGAAYGAIEEGLLEPNWFTPALQTHPYGVALGVFWTYAVWNLGYHAVFSIAIPILLTELAFPVWRDKPWLGRAGTSVVGAVYAVNAAGIGLLWWAYVQPVLLHVPARVHPVQQGTAIALVIALIAAARLAAGIRTSSAAGPPPPAAGWLAGAAALGATAWFGLLLLSASDNYLHWLPFPVPITVAAGEVALAAWALRRWSARTDLQVLAVCAGALVVQMAAGFGVLGAAGPVNIIGKAVLNIIAACLLAWFALRLRRRHAHDQHPPAPPPAISPSPRAPAQPAGDGREDDRGTKPTRRTRVLSGLVARSRCRVRHLFQRRTRPPDAYRVNATLPAVPDGGRPELPDPRLATRPGGTAARRTESAGTLLIRTTELN
jgi:hypothetical protein